MGYLVRLLNGSFKEKSILISIVVYGAQLYRCGWQG